MGYTQPLQQAQTNADKNVTKHDTSNWESMTVDKLGSRGHKTTQFKRSQGLDYWHTCADASVQVGSFG